MDDFSQESNNFRRSCFTISIELTNLQDAALTDEFLANINHSRNVPSSRLRDAFECQRERAEIIARQQEAERQAKAQRQEAERQAEAEIEAEEQALEAEEQADSIWIAADETLLEAAE